MVGPKHCTPAATSWSHAIVRGLAVVLVRAVAESVPSSRHVFPCLQCAGQCPAPAPYHVCLCLVDAGSVVVHAFTEPARNYYNIEQLWEGSGGVVTFLEDEGDAPLTKDTLTLEAHH